MQRKRDFIEPNERPTKRAKVQSSSASITNVYQTANNNVVHREDETQALKAFFDSVINDPKVYLAINEEFLSEFNKYAIHDSEIIAEECNFNNFNNGYSQSDYPDQAYLPNHFIAAAPVDVFDNAPLSFDRDIGQLRPEIDIFAADNQTATSTAKNLVITPVVATNNEKPISDKQNNLEEKAKLITALTASFNSGQTKDIAQLIRSAQGLFPAQQKEQQANDAEMNMQLFTKVLKVTFHQLTGKNCYCFISDLKANGITREALENVLRESYKHVRKLGFTNITYIKPALFENEILQVSTQLLKYLGIFCKQQEYLIKPKQYTVKNVGQSHIMRSLMGCIEQNAYYKPQSGETLSQLVAQAKEKYWPEKAPTASNAKA